MENIFLEILKQTWYIWIIIFVIPFLIKLFKPKTKGFVGEKSISILLATLDKKKYKIINDLRLRIEGKSTQIDHVVLSNFGIFVIETKNYKGWIFGKEHEDYWKQVIYKEKNTFKNPIKQNKYHIWMLKKALKDHPDLDYHSLIVFLANAELKTNTNNGVIYPQKMLRRIRSYDEEVISDEVKNGIFDYLERINIKNLPYGNK
jgi:hypothetical protein